MSNRIISTLFDTKGAVNLGTNDEFEVQPGVFSPVYINFKAVLGNSDSRKRITSTMLDSCREGFTHVCGIESGGAYYAAAVADGLDLGLSLFRRNIKSYNIKNRFAGNMPAQEDSVLLLDDVMSSGNTIADAVQELGSVGCKVEIMVAFSYCWENEIAENLSIPVSALSTAEDLIEHGVRTGQVGPEHVRLIRDYVISEEKRVVGND